MTTIATDGRTIATDGKGCAGGEVMTLGEVKLRVAHGRVYALTGVAAVFDAAVAWHADGADPGKVPRCGEHEWQLLVIEKGASGLVRYTSSVPWAERSEFPQAFGSGRPYALAALHCGRHPREAVELAARLDVYTGGNITVIDIEAALGAVPQQRAPAAVAGGSVRRSQPVAATASGRKAKPAARPQKAAKAGKPGKAGKTGKAGTASSKRAR